MPVIQKELPQWFVRITAYADELLGGTYELTGWPEAVRIMQRNWLGKSQGAEIDFLRLFREMQVVETLPVKALPVKAPQKKTLINHHRLPLPCSPRGLIPCSA